jgi:hypothetical protein
MELSRKNQIEDAVGTDAGQLRWIKLLKQIPRRNIENTKLSGLSGVRLFLI